MKCTLPPGEGVLCIKDDKRNTSDTLKLNSFIIENEAERNERKNNRI